ncbi:MAG: glycolate oxidase subunit GlcE [Panacagrimonas sp.]
MPAPIYRIQSVDELRELLTEAAEHEGQLRVLGGRSKAALIGAEETHVGLDMSGLSGITRYEPEELVLTARAGTRLAEISAVLAERGQRLAFDPPDFAALLGSRPERTTLGGIVASGLAGSNRLSAGNVRDHVLGFEAVSGHGEVFRAGGRVMKNVTGYDLPKLMTGSWGTLAVLTEITVRVLPQPQYETTLLIDGLDDHAGIAAMGAALRAPLEVAAAALFAGRESITAIRLEGLQSSVIERAGQLRGLLQAAGGLRGLEGEASAECWRVVREVRTFENDEHVVWRLSLPASESAAVVAAIAAQVRVQVLYDWGGSLVWLRMGTPDDAAAAVVRHAVARVGGHAWLMRAPAAVRQKIPTAHPQPAGLAALGQRIRSRFDPGGVFNGEPLWPEKMKTN